MYSSLLVNVLESPIVDAAHFSFSSASFHFLLLLLLLCNPDVNGRHFRSLNFRAEIRLEHYLPDEYLF